MTVAAYIYLILMLFGVGMIVEMARRLETGTLTIIAFEKMHDKSLDLAARGASYVEALPDDLLQDVLERVRLSIE